MEAKIWTAAEIKANLADKDEWLFRGLLAIYDYQTQDEQDVGEAKYLNGVGFSGAHAYFAGQMAQLLKRNVRLSPKQIACTRRIMLHYSEQLARIANHEQNKRG